MRAPLVALLLALLLVAAPVAGASCHFCFWDAPEPLRPAWRYVMGLLP